MLWFYIPSTENNKTTSWKCRKLTKKSRNCTLHMKENSLSGFQFSIQHKTIRSRSSSLPKLNSKSWSFSLFASPGPGTERLLSALVLCNLKEKTVNHDTELTKQCFMCGSFQSKRSERKSINVAHFGQVFQQQPSFWSENSLISVGTLAI